MRVLYINTNPSISNKIIDDSYDNGVYYMEKTTTEVSLSHHSSHNHHHHHHYIIIRLKPRTLSMVCSNTETHYHPVIDDVSMSTGVLVLRLAPSSTVRT